MTVVFDAFLVPLAYGAGADAILPEGLDVVGAEIIEADLTVRLHYVADEQAVRMKRRVAAAPQGSRVPAGRHLYTVIRLGVPFHYCIEE